MTDTTHLTANEHDISTAKLWRNLIFMKNGRSMLGHRIFASESEAQAAIIAGEVFTKHLLEIHSNVRFMSHLTGEFMYWGRDYSHSMPIPCAR